MARVRHSMRWRSVGAAATFLLAAAAGVVGNRATGRVTPALVVFAVLVIAGMLVTYVLDRHARARSSADNGTEGGAVSQAEPIDLHDAQGVQIGNDNWQQNYFGPGTGSGHRE
jgi:hypothetical protein